MLVMRGGRKRQIHRYGPIICKLCEEVERDRYTDMDLLYASYARR